ncbi:MAG: hypothetical protein ACI9NN_000476 [Bacteroidia bacterium]|jgi:uncharacterized protein (DUF2147 family)
MKNILLIALAIMFFSSFTSSTLHVQSSSADVLGVYFNAEKDAKIQIYLASNNKYAGKVLWMSEPKDENSDYKKDAKNPDEALRTRTRLGLVILENFVFDADDDRWEDGSVYDPKTGKTYSGYMKFEDGNIDQLFLRGYVAGIPLLGRTAEWTRVK